jgi:hypothetical protein
MPSPRMTMKANVKKLADERDRLLDQIAALQNKIAGLELAMNVLTRDDAQQTGAGPGKRGKAKNVLLDLLREVRETGLNASLAVELADKRGIKLERGTAASNLSRMKADNVVTYDGERYRLPEFTRPKIAVVDPTSRLFAAAGGVKSS